MIPNIENARPSFSQPRSKMRIPQWPQRGPSLLAKTLKRKPAWSLSTPLRASLRTSALALLAATAVAAPFQEEQEDEAGAAEAAPEIVVLRGQRLIVRPGKVMEPGAVLVQDGKILQIAEDFETPPGATEISGPVICAGFMDPWSVLGVSSQALSDGSANAASRTADAVDLWSGDHLREEALRAGVTAARVQMARDAFISGIGAVVRLGGDAVEDSLVLEDAVVAANVGLSAEGGGRFVLGPDGSFSFVGGIQAMDPFDRIAQVDRLVSQIEAGAKYSEDQVEYGYELEEWEEAIAEKEKELEKDFKKAKKDRAKDEKKAKEDGKELKEKKYKEDKKPKAPRYDAEKEIWARVANGELPLIVQAHRAAELRTLLEGTKDLDRLRLVLAGATEAMHHAPELARRGIAVIVWPAPLGRADKGSYDEWEGHKLSLAAELSEAGVPVLIGSGGVSARATRDLPVLAALAIGHGFDREKAFEALTLGAARAMDVADHLGSVEPGKQADLLVLDGEPLRSTTRVRYVLAGGEVVVSPEDN